MTEDTAEFFFFTAYTQWSGKAFAWQFYRKELIGDRVGGEEMALKCAMVLSMIGALFVDVTYFNSQFDRGWRWGN
jgi:hypothetical protein